MVWIFLKGEKRDSDYSGCFMVGRRKVKSIRFFFFMLGSGKRAHGLGLCFFFAVLISIVVCFALFRLWLVFFSPPMSFSGFEPL